MNKMKQAFLSCIIMLFALSAAHAQSTCTVSGTLQDLSGVPAVGVTLRITPLAVGGIPVTSAPIRATSIAGGAVSFVAVQGAAVRIEGPIIPYNRPGGVDRFIPTTSTALLADLQPVVMVLSNSVTVKQSGTIIGNKISVFDFLNATVTQTPTGEANITVTPAWADVSGKPSTFTPANHAASHQAGGSDVVTLTIAQTTGLQTELDTKLTQAQADALYSVLAHTHTFASLTSKPTTLSGYGITDAQPLDSQLTDLAGLSYAGNSLKVVRVNAGETGFELASAAGGAIDGSGAANRVALWSDADTLSSSANFSFSGTTLSVSGKLNLDSTGSGAIAIGPNNPSVGTSGIRIGSAGVSGSEGVSVGHQGEATGLGAHQYGYAGKANDDNAASFGDNVHIKTGGRRTVVIASGITISVPDVTIIGGGAGDTSHSVDSFSYFTPGDVYLGISQDPVGVGTIGTRRLIIGRGYQHSQAEDISIRVTAIAGSNAAGKKITLLGGASTGTGLGGPIELGTTSSGSTGSSLNAYTTAKLFVPFNDVLALRNGTTGQSFRINNTFTDESNQEFVRHHWSTSIYSIEYIGAGSGSAAKIIRINPKGTGGANDSAWDIDAVNTGGSNAALVPVTDNANQIGFSNRRPSALKIGTGGIIYGSGSGDDTAFIRLAAGVLRVSNASTGTGSLAIGPSTVSVGTSGAGVLVIGGSTAPTTSPADLFQLWSADINAVAGQAGAHFRNEINTSALILPGVRYKTDTGDPSDTFEGMLVINTFDNTFKVFAEGAWRTITTW